MTGREIIKVIMAERGIGPKDFFGDSRMRHVVRARAAAIRQMRDAGMSNVTIGRVMKRDYSTVRYWALPEDRRRRLAYGLAYHAALREAA
jgi:chromosomal replication initiation ATPase DnaA